MSRPVRFLLTQSLLAAWEWQYKAEDAEAAHKAFLRVLRRKHTPESTAIRNGIQFENMVSAYCDGIPPPAGHKWEKGIREIGEQVKGGVLQAALYKDVCIDGLRLLLYGRLDVLKAGTIYDIKCSRTYEPGKYLDSPQHPMYLELCPEADRFTYLVWTKNKDVCRETYTRRETPPIESVIRPFISYLENTGLDQIYTEKWKARY